MKPAVSIIIPLYNKGRYIAETVRSVINQSEESWELLIVDNGSTDAGPEMILAMDDPRVRLLSSSKRGASAARNHGYDQAAGEWLVFLDADDLLEPGYLRSQLDHSPGTDVVICPYVEFADGKTSERCVKFLWRGEPSREKLLDSAIVFAPGPTHSFLIRRAFLRPEVLWPEHLDRLLGEDATFWFRLLNEARLGFNEQPVALYRFWAPESRFTTLSNPSDLFGGLHAAVLENLLYLDRRGKEPTSAQAESLMRFYANVYLKANQQHDVDTSAKALDEAQQWQERYFETCPSPSLPMQMRRWLGLPLFSRLSGRA